MTIQEKLGIIYAKNDCASRPCENCVANSFCGSGDDIRNLIRTVQTEIRELCKAKEEANEKEG